tara:strand:+ start:5122 stop:5784 length:663 start_codon:yes stop_codon:yes gene_type:complete
MGFENVGKSWSVDSFSKFLRTQDLGWAKGITIHHTASPTLAQRPSGWKINHLHNLAHYYGKKLDWSSGPHLFIDEDQVFGLSSLERRGVHARSFNRTHIGIEVLGNYDIEDPRRGRGIQCWENAGNIVRCLLDATSNRLKGKDVNFHRDDPKTSKTCPGTKVSYGWFQNLIPAVNPLPPAPEIPDKGDHTDSEDGFDVGECLEAIEWQLGKIRKGLEKGL